MRTIFIGKPDQHSHHQAAVLAEMGHHVDEVMSPIEANDLILSSMARNLPCELIVIHQSHLSSDTGVMISYWRSQDPFLPLILIGNASGEGQDKWHEWGILDCIPEDAPDHILLNRIQFLESSQAIAAAYKLKAAIIEIAGQAHEVPRVVSKALNMISQAVNLPIAFVCYTENEDEPMVQIAENLDIDDQIWLDRTCEEPEIAIQPILESGRKVHEDTDTTRYIYPISTKRGWEGILAFIPRDLHPKPFRNSQCNILAEGISSMLSMVRQSQVSHMVEKTKAEYMAIISKNLRSPLADLKSSADLLLMVDLESHVSDMVTKLAKNVQISIDILENLIELSLIDKGMVIIQATTVDLPPLVEGVVEDLRHLFTEKNVKTKIDKVDGGNYNVEGDPAKLRKVFTNLLNNAARFTAEHSEIEIRFRADEEVVEVTIKDEGPGLLPDQVEAVFERGFQNEDGIISGKGIGLYICKKFIKAHEGQIWVKSQFGLGAEFTVRLRRPV